MLGAGPLQIAGFQESYSPVAFVTGQPRLQRALKHKPRRLERFQLSMTAADSIGLA